MTPSLILFIVVILLPSFPNFDTEHLSRHARNNGLSVAKIGNVVGGILKREEKVHFDSRGLEPDGFLMRAEASMDSMICFKSIVRFALNGDAAVVHSFSLPG